MWLIAPTALVFDGTRCSGLSCVALMVGPIGRARPRLCFPASLIPYPTSVALAMLLPLVTFLPWSGCFRPIGFTGTVHGDVCSLGHIGDRRWGGSKLTRGHRGGGPIKLWIIALSFFHDDAQFDVSSAKCLTSTFQPSFPKMCFNVTV